MSTDNPDGAAATDDLVGAWGRELAIAARLFTIVPVGPAEPTAEEAARAARAFPLIGLALGVGGAVVYGVLRHLGLDGLAAAAVAVLLLTAVDGARLAGRVGGFLRALDGAAVKAEAETAQTRDLVFTILLLVTRIGAIASMTAVVDGAAAIAAGAAGSYALIPLVHAALPAAPGAAKGPFAQVPPTDRRVTAAAFGLIFVLLFLNFWPGILAVVFALAVAGGVAALARWRPGGYDAGVLAAVQVLAELVVILVVAAHAAGA